MQAILYKDILMNRKTLLQLIDHEENEYKVYKTEKIVKKRSLIRRVLSKVKRIILKVFHFIKIVINGKILKIVKVKIDNSKHSRIKRGKILLNKILPTEDIKEKERNTIFIKDVKFSIIVPLFNTPDRFLREMISSVLNQTYGNFELCMADGSDKSHSYVEKIVNEYKKNDNRIKYKKLEKNRGISENTNSCIEMASGDYLALFDHDDILHPEALFFCMKEIVESKADFIYTDEITFNSPDLYDIRDIQYKPDFAREDILGLNYICHFLVFDKKLLDGNTLYDSSYDGSQDHEMILRLSSIAKNIRHISKILYFWRIHPLSVASDISAKSYAISAGKKAVIDTEKKRGRNVSIKSTALCATHYRLFYELYGDMVDIIIMGKSDEKKSLNYSILKEEILKNTAYKNINIHYIDISMGLNAAISKIKEKLFGKYILFMDEKNRILKSNWLDLLVMYIQKEEVGAVSGRGISLSGKMIENGYLKGVVEDNPLFPIDRGCMFNEMGNMARNYYVHNVSIISLNNLMIKRDTLFNDICIDCNLKSYKMIGADISLKLEKIGKEIVIHPYSLILVEEDTKETEKEMLYFKEKYKKELEKKDPYYNENYSNEGNWAIYE